jgi:4-amino-4-deoxyprephenate dehydrogenase
LTLHPEGAGAGETPAFAHCVVVGGEGEVGRLFANLLAAEPRRVIAVVDPRALLCPGDRFRRYAEDFREPSAKLLTEFRCADLVLLATPESVALQGLAVLGHHLPARCLLVDSLSVKSPMAARVQAAMAGIEAVGVNPMFAPGLGFRGQSAIATRYCPGPRGDEFLSMIEAECCRVQLMSADQHDRHTAILQVATHAAILTFGMVLLRQGYDLAACEAVMPPPHRTLLALLARVLRADPEVYWDIQLANPYGQEVRAQLQSSMQELQATLGEADAARFRADLEQLRTLLGDARGRYEGLCAKLFATLTESVSDWPGR